MSDEIRYSIDPLYHVNLIGYPDLELPSNYYFSKNHSLDDVRSAMSYFVFKHRYGYAFSGRAFFRPKMIPGKIDMDEAFKEKLDAIIIPVARELIKQYEANPELIAKKVQEYNRKHDEAYLRTPIHPAPVTYDPDE